MIFSEKLKELLDVGPDIFIFVFIKANSLNRSSVITTELRNKNIYELSYTYEIL